MAQNGGNGSRVFGTFKLPLLTEWTRNGMKNCRVSILYSIISGRARGVPGIVPL